MTAISTEELARLLETTTPGPWRAAMDHPTNACAYVSQVDGYHDIATCYGGVDVVPSPKEGEPWAEQPIRDANARLIALAAERDRLRAENSVMKDALGIEEDELDGLLLEAERLELVQEAKAIAERDALQATVATIPAQIAAARVEMRDAAIKTLTEGPNTVGKTDKCSHGRFGYEDCEECCLDAIRALPIPDTDALEMAECAAHSAGYEAGELDGFNAGLKRMGQYLVVALSHPQLGSIGDIIDDAARALKRSGKGAEG